MSDDLTIAYQLGVEDMRSKLHKQADEIERLRAENARLYALLVEAQDYIDDIYLYIAIGKELEGHDLRDAAAAIRESGK